jgi:DNA polymerase III epsilon subunit family exonuclease
VNGGIRFERQDGLHARAVSLLRERPLGTTELARRLMGMQGAPAVAARAVWALLGTDARFRVDAAGVWSLAGAEPAAPERAEPELALFRRLRDEEWVVVDVETTGGTPERGHRITEVAAVRVSGGVIRDRYCTLVNPMRTIPSMVTSITGISPEMVRAAPHFGEVAYQVAEAIEGAVFVAHNAAFDWAFVSHEMQRATGTLPAGRQLCTVRLAKKLMPQLTSRGLDSLAHWFGLEIVQRHRALDDAVATAEVLIRFLEMLEERGVEDWDGLQALLKKRVPRKTRKRRANPRSMDAA